jgi:hypothetical protein
VDSTPTQAAPGRLINLKAVIAPTPKDAAKYYPADYWYSLIQVPDKGEFPMKPTPPPAYAAAAQSAGPATSGPSGDEEFTAQKSSGMENQQQWIDTMKRGCQSCHQIGDSATRNITHLTKYNVTSSGQAWATRLHFSQKGSQMMRVLARYVDQDRAIKMFADWTDRIAAGEVPPAPPRPQGIERNVVITMWDWGKFQSLVHDEVSTDRRKPTLNANGMVYAADYQNDQIVTLDPLRNATDAIDVPTRQDKSTMQPTGPPSMPLPSPFWGENIIWDSVAGPHSVMMDEKGRVWTTSTIRSSANPDFCKEGSNNPYARYFPLKSSGKQVIMYDPETKQFKMVDTCFSTHHLQFAPDKEDTLFFSAPGKPEVGWLDTQMLAKTGDAEKSQGWCPAYLDTKGTGQIDPAVDRRIDISSYGLVVNPVDQSVWLASPGVPTRIIRVSRGSTPPSTCSAELYEPPFNSPGMPGVAPFGAQGIDVDRDGVVWVAFSSSGQLASFDRRKCKAESATTVTGRQCPEGWSLYTTPGPKMKGVTDDSSADFLYYNWVDQFNTLGLGDNIPIVNGTDSDSLEAFIPSSKKWVVLRVPYPMGFYSRGLDGRIDDPGAGWKGRAVWADYGDDVLWHVEGGAGTRSKVVKFQIRPDPLAH